MVPLNATRFVPWCGPDPPLQPVPVDRVVLAQDLRLAAGLARERSAAQVAVRAGLTRRLRLVVVVDAQAHAAHGRDVGLAELARRGVASERRQDDQAVLSDCRCECVAVGRAGPS